MQTDIRNNARDAVETISLRNHNNVEEHFE